MPGATAGGIAVLNCTMKRQSILELKNGWEARVKAGRYLDIYKVTDDKELKYEFTE